MTATDQEEEPAPARGEDAMFRAMFGDLMAEARAGRLNPETGPPSTHGPACGCPACLEAVAAAKGIAWSAAE